MTALSVVVADVARDRAVAERSTTALVEQLRPEDELVVVDGDPTSNRGDLYATGLARARCPAVAFTDSTTIVGTGWRDAADEAIARGPVGGGPVLPARPRSTRSWAGFFVEYGPHAVAPFRSATGDVAANNVVYDRAALDAVLVPGEPVWKFAVNARLRERGHTPAVVPSLRVEVARGYDLHDLTGARARAGRLFGAQRAAAHSLRWRGAAALGCVLLPVLAYLRLARRMRSDRALRGPFMRSTPFVLLALVCWSAGEARGYWSGAAGSDGVF
jgi:hypothetical protein